MKSIRSHMGLVALLLGFLVGSAQAQLLLYDNGTMQVNGNGWAVTGPLSVSNSFTLTGPSSIQVMNVALMVQESFTIGGLTWAMGSTAFGGDLRGATVADPDFVLLDTENGYDYYMSTIYIDNPVLVSAAGTYWLTLANAFVENESGHEVYWVESNGPSLAWQVQTPNPPTSLPNSQFFAIIGVPEPTTTTLVVGGLVAFVLRRRRERPTDS